MRIFFVFLKIKNTDKFLYWIITRDSDSLESWPKAACAEGG
jgi:hypothetical protein